MKKATLENGFWLWPNKNGTENNNSNKKENIIHKLIFQPNNTHLHITQNTHVKTRKKRAEADRSDKK